jgi:hypothetical protein
VGFNLLQFAERLPHPFLALARRAFAGGLLTPVTGSRIASGGEA